jgi:hypothetical protein
VPNADPRPQFCNAELGGSDRGAGAAGGVKLGRREQEEGEEEPNGEQHPRMGLCLLCPLVSWRDWGQ